MWRKTGRRMEVSNWEKLFGSPELAARTIVEYDLYYELTDECEACSRYDECKETIATQPCQMDDEDAILRWLNDD